MTRRSGLGFSGLLVARIVAADPDAVVVEGMDGLRHGRPVFDRRPDGLWASRPLRRPNAFVNLGLQIALDRLFGLGSVAAVSHIGVSADNAVVDANTVRLDPAGDATGIAVKALSPAATRTGQTVTGGAAFTQADVAFAIRKVGFLNKATDDGTGLLDVIGGTGGAAPYNDAFLIDLTGTTPFTLTMNLQVTASAV